MLIDRLWAKIHIGETDCWEWTGYRDRAGYGTIKVDGEMMLVHRASYEVHRGAIPPGEGHHGTCVMHICDNRCCVNPAHLMLGTQVENIADRDSKGRQQRVWGEAKASAKLKEADILAIRAEKPRHGLHAHLGRQFGVSANQIQMIRTGRSWRHPIPLRGS